MSKQIQPHQQRVIDEEKDLSEKLNKLQNFINDEVFSALPHGEQGRLREQADHMLGYRNVLLRRIENF